MNLVADIIVSGAGHNGLVCAGYLAKAELDVLVVEQSHRIGGACVTEELVPGYHFSTFDYGAHGPGSKICSDLEVGADAFRVETIDPSTFFPFPDGDHIMLWTDADKTAAGLARFGPREVNGYAMYLAFLTQATQIAEEWFLRPPMTHAQFYDKYDGTEKAQVLETLLTRSHWDVLCDYFDSEKVRWALARADDVGDPTGVGSLLAEVCELASTGAGIENRSGVVHGGMGMITQALADAARRFGAQIRVKSSVQHIVVEHGRTIGVQLESGSMLRARLVVSNADPKRTFLKLARPDDLELGFRRQVQTIKT